MGISTRTMTSGFEFMRTSRVAAKILRRRKERNFHLSVETVFTVWCLQSTCLHECLFVL